MNITNTNDINNNKNRLLYSNLNNQVSDKYSNIPKIRVAVRKRPLNKKEIQKNDIDIIESKDNNTCIVKELKNKVDLTKYIEEHHFIFDCVFDEKSTNENIYLELVRPMVEAAFETKAKITCLAYGQTGSGKTYTMMGPGNLSGNSNQIVSPGLYLLSAYDIIQMLDKKEYEHLDIWVSFYEIYCNKLYDLLNERNTLYAREDGKQNICIVGLQEKSIKNLKEFLNLIEYGLKTRTTGVTGANADSSRSHAILQINIKDRYNNLPNGKISFIDLAGSERAVDTIDTNKQTKIDGAEINKSLLALKECIRALDQEKKHTPFRGSKLTLVLRDSFIGNCKTLMFANISPGLSCSEHTLNTLRYADRVKDLKKDKGVINNNVCNKEEELANLLMMPRQHNKTVKYTIDKKTFNKFNSNSNIVNSISGVKHINNLIMLNNNSNSNVNVNNKIAENINIANTKNMFNDNKPKYSNNYCNLKNPNSIDNLDNIDNISNIIPDNSYTEFNQEYNSKYNNIQLNSEDDYNKYTQEHENLINNILQEEESFISMHKQHIDDTVDIVKNEMNILNEVDKPGSDIDLYVNSLDKLLIEKQNKIVNIRNKLFSLYSKLKDEEVLSSKFSDFNFTNKNETN